MTTPPPAKYFPVRDEPLKMSPGLFRLGSDFGNGPRDHAYFQRDSQAPEFEKEKSRILSTFPGRLQQLSDERASRVLSHVRRWMLDTLQEEYGLAVAGGPLDFSPLSLALQEDFAVLEETPEGENRLLLLSVCFPSGWQPEKLLGQSFSFTHEPIPEFEAIAQRQQAIVSAMIERGPYVRFVWTVTADSRLDHHPVQAPRDSWRPNSQGVLRVERQVTVPFPDERASLFLIRTYRYPLSALDAEQRQTLKGALEKMPSSLLAYKGLRDALPHILPQLG
jgi:hypothetical protein